MHIISVDRAELEKTLKLNREKHVTEFAEANGLYMEALAKDLKKKIRKLKEGEMVTLNFQHLPRPENHAEDYDRALSMLSWHTSDVIEVTEREFEQYINDEWGWKGQFLATTSNYLLNS